MGGRWGHLGGVCAVWKPCALDWSHMGARFHHLEGGWSRICRYGSHMHQTELPALWESDGTMWEPHVTYEDHRRAVCTVWVVCAPYLMQMVPYGSHIHCEGTIRELCAPSRSHV